MQQLPALLDPLTTRPIENPQKTNCGHIYSLSSAIALFGEMKNQRCAHPNKCKMVLCGNIVQTYAPVPIAQQLLGQAPVNRFDIAPSTDLSKIRFTNPGSPDPSEIELSKTECSIKFTSSFSKTTFLQMVFQEEDLSEVANERKLGFNEELLVLAFNDATKYCKFIKFAHYKYTFTKQARDLLFAFSDMLSGETTPAAAVQQPVKSLPFKKFTFSVEKGNCEVILRNCDREENLTRIVIAYEKGYDYCCNIKIHSGFDQSLPDSFYDYLDARSHIYQTLGWNSLKIKDSSEVFRILNLLEKAFFYQGTARTDFQEFIAIASNPKP